MLASWKYNVVIYTPYKNASTSIEAFFKRDRSFTTIYGEQVCYNTTPANKRKHGKHTPLQFDFMDRYECFPYQRGKTRIFLPIRHPYTRVKSMYYFFLSKAAMPMDFDQWFLSKSKAPNDRPVTKYFPYTDLIRFEHLEKDLLKITKDFNMQFEDDNYEIPHIKPPRDLSHKNKPPIELTQFQKDAIYYFHYEDFVNGRYQR